MNTKKKLIVRMASWAGGILVLAALVGIGALLNMGAERQRFEEAQKRGHADTQERTRKYLAELSKRIDRLPVDQTLVGEVEARYFEEGAHGTLHVWAMGTNGEFLFGVPKEAFSRLNAVYDREITPRLKEGVYFDRQAFLLGHLEDSAGPVLTEDLSGTETGELLSKLRRLADREDGAYVLSAPLKKQDGGALGSLYVRREPARELEYRPDVGLEQVAGGAGGVAALAFVFLWVLLPTWVYVDARDRGVRRAPLFAFLTVLSSLVGLVVYLIARPEDAGSLTCPACSREVNGGSFCPHCGRDLSSSFCAACRYPLKPDWAFCPACRAEIRPATVAGVEAPATR